MASGTGKKVSNGGAAAHSEEQRYRAIFQRSAVSLWEEDITELRAAILALQPDGTSSLRDYLDKHPEFLRRATHLIKVIDVNDATLRLYEVARKEDLLGPLATTLDLDDTLMLSSLREEILLIAEGENLYTHESTAVTPGGKKLNIVVEAHIPGPDDAYPHMLVSVIDVTEQRRAEEALRESERELHHSQQMLRSALDNIPQRVFWKDLELRFLGCNQAFAVDAGLADSSAIAGKDDFQMPWHSMAERYRADDRRVLATGVHLLNYEEPQVLSDGTELWVRTNKVPLRDRDGKVVGLLGTYEDITERMNLERNLQREKTLLLTLIDNLPDYVYLKDRESRFVLANRAIAHFMGLERPAQLIGRTDRDFYPQQDAEKFIADERRVIEEGRSIVNLEESIVTPVGSVRRVLTTKVPLVDAEGRITGLVGIGRDITEIRGTEEALRRSEEQLQLSSRLEAVGRLAGGIAHDFNNLLTVIKGYADLLEGSLAEKNPLRSDIQQIKRSAQRAGDLTAQLLAFSRRQVRTPRIIGLNEVIRGMEGMLARLIGEDIQLVTGFAEGLGSIKADPGQIEQVMMNLAANARDAMPLGGTITVETSNGTLGSGPTPPQFASIPGEFVLLTVSDTGEGMDRETMGKIFEPFFTTKEMGKGTGLGLATVYGIVKQSGGFIFCDSEPGKGTRFTLSFPRVNEQPAADQRKQHGASPARGTESILLVEDEQAIRGFIAAALRNAGYTVKETRNGREALAAAQGGFAAKLLLTDVVMPLMNGRELGRRMQTRFPGVKILYMSGYTEGPVVHQGILDPGIDFMAKPFDAEELLARVRRALDTEAG
jgi:two-component system, cell cycle sensor histidine kinase and response regulator CckA